MGLRKICGFGGSTESIMLLGSEGVRGEWRRSWPGDLGMTQPAVSISVKRGEGLANAKGLALLDK